MAGESEPSKQALNSLAMLAGSMDSMTLNFRPGAPSNDKQPLTLASLQQQQQQAMLTASIGLADKHFKPIEVEARKIKEQQRSNLAEKLKAIEQQV